MKRTSLLSLFIALGLTGTAMADTTARVRNGAGEEILLQGFHWNSNRNEPEKWYALLARMAGQIGNDGFTAIWMPPPWRDDSSWVDAIKGTSGGGEGYFWRSFDKNSQYGSDEQLKTAAAALNTAGVQVVYDVVPNHMDDSRVNASLFPRGRNEWRHDCATCDEGDAFMDGNADLNTGNPAVSETFKNELVNLRQLYGAKGLRFDFVRGYAPETVERWMTAVGDQPFCIGEVVERPQRIPGQRLAQPGQLAGFTQGLVRPFPLLHLRLCPEGTDAERFNRRMAAWAQRQSRSQLAQNCGHLRR